MLGEKNEAGRVTPLPMIGGQSEGNQLSRPCHGILLSEHGMSHFVDHNAVFDL